MSETKQIPPDHMQAYFDGFSRRFLRRDSTATADVEVLGMNIGDQIEEEGARLIGISYDPRERALELDLDTAGLRAYQPKEVWAIEEEDGFISGLEIVRDDDTKEIVRVRRQTIRRAD